MKLEWNSNPAKSEIEWMRVGAFVLHRSIYPTLPMMIYLDNQHVLEIDLGDDANEAAALTWIRDTCTETLTALDTEAT